MSPRRRSVARLLSLALAAGVLGAGLADSLPAGAAVEPRPLMALLGERAGPTVETAPPAVELSTSATSTSGLSSRPPTPAGSSSAPSPSSSPSPVSPPVPPAAREGFARSLAIPAGTDAAAAAAAAVAPVSVAVPRIGVDTALVSLGISTDGSLEVPGRDEFDRAGWLTTSAVPGQAGASIIAGHVDSTTGPAVFFRLHDLVPGDEVDVTLGDGSRVVFVVDAVQRVSKEAFPSAEVYGPQPGPVLRLITCGGAFDRATGHYEDNVIAFASLR